MTGIYWGVLQSNTSAALVQMETDAGKRASIYGFGSSWYGTDDYPNGAYKTAGSGSSIRTFLNLIRGHGAIPMLDWYSQHDDSDTAFSLKKIYGGEHDAFLAQFAQDIAAWGHPLFIRMDGEMNGTWHPPYYELNGFGDTGFENAEGDFILMWRHVVDIFRANGAVNVSWVWSPNHQPPSGSENMTYESIFPGSAYVDWLAIDGYNWGGGQAGGGNNQPWMTFTEVFTGYPGWLGDSWSELCALDPNLPIMIAETACDSREGTDTNASAATAEVWNGTKKATWIIDTLNTQVPGSFNRIKAFCWFNDAGGVNPPPITGGFFEGDADWPFQDPTVASGKSGGGEPQTAFGSQTGINSTYYVRGNQLYLPSGMRKVQPYEGTPQVSFFTNAVLHTAQGHLQGYWKNNETSGTTADDSSGNSRDGTYTGGFTLSQPKIIPGTLDLATRFNGSTGYITIPDADEFSLSNGGELSVMVVFKMVALPGAGQATLVSKAGGTGYEWAIRVNSSGALLGDHWNLGGDPYFSVATSSSTIAAGSTYIAVLTMDQSRSPVARMGRALIGASSASFGNSSDTLANTPANGTGAVNIGRRGDASQYANAVISHVAIWDACLSDLSVTELVKASGIRRDKPRTIVT